MTIFPPVLFALGGLAAVLTIWRTLSSALPAIKSLREQLASEGKTAIHVTTRDMREHGKCAPARKARQRRHIQPKPVTHRLHQYPWRANAA